MDSPAAPAAILRLAADPRSRPDACPRVGRGPGREPRPALTILSMGCVCIVAFVASYGLLFAFGVGAAWVGVIAPGVAIAATPVVWALILRRRARRSSPHG